MAKTVKEEEEEEEDKDEQSKKRLIMKNEEKCNANESFRSSWRNRERRTVQTLK